MILDKTALEQYAPKKKYDNFTAGRKQRNRY